MKASLRAWLVVSASLCAAGCSGSNGKGTPLEPLPPSATPAPDAGPDAALAPPQSSPPNPSQPPSGPGGPGPICERIDTGARPVTPRMLILSDRSSSMTEDTVASTCPPCYHTRWDGSVSAVQSVTRELQHDINFGLMLFPTVGGEPNADGIRCDAGEVSVSVGPGNAQAIEAAFEGVNARGSTPTAAALRAARRSLVDEPAAIPDFEFSPAYVLLVTDGEPRCDVLDVDQQQPLATLTALDDLLDAGVPTYVVGYSLGGKHRAAAREIMDAMAEHGGTQQYYPAEDEQELVTALRDITAQVVSCEYQLDEEPPRGDEYIHVTLDGIDVAPGSDGWTRDGRMIRLSGATCDALRDGEDHSLSIAVECEPVIID